MTVSKTPAQMETEAASSKPSSYDAQRIRDDFPVLAQTIHGKQLVYLDNAATSQKPQAVIDALIDFYTKDCANIHRGVHHLSERATKAYEDSRSKVRQFIHAKDDREIVFVRGATEAINLVAQSFGKARLGAGDEVVISALEHHSNIVPWQMLCSERGGILRVIPMNDKGELLMESYQKLLNPRTRIIAISQISNALGTINPVESMIEIAHSKGVPVLIDGAQAIQHTAVDVQKLDCDFYVFSGHKMYGPSGIGVLYGKAEHLESMPPYQGGGDMISSVTFEKTTYNKIPYKFEAGTPNIAGSIGLGAAIDYLNTIGMDHIAAHEHQLLTYATEAVASIPGVRIVGTARQKAGVVSFLVDGIHPHDIGTILDQEGIAIRTGHHCAQPVMDFFGIPATARASFGLYNIREEIDALVAGIFSVIKVFN
jgi:cysteine desulfurase/selenocysteine lyase